MSSDGVQYIFEPGVGLDAMHLAGASQGVEQSIPLRLTASCEPGNNLSLRPGAQGRIGFSTGLLSIFRRPSLKKISGRAINKSMSAFASSIGISKNSLRHFTCSKITTKLYLAGNYVNDTLQFIGTGEGRARIKDSTLIVYDYFLKDHLGNIRMVLTDEQRTDAYPPASLEPAQLAVEDSIYSGLDSGRIKIELVADYPSDAYTDPNDYVQKLNGNGPRIGSGIVLKVMAGDEFNLRVSSWWKSNNTPGTPQSPVNSLLNVLNNGIGSIAGSHGTATEFQSLGSLNGPISDFLNNQGSYDSSRPKAFVNWILFDEQFNYVSNSSGFEQVGISDDFSIHLKTALTLEKNGYLYVYVSNESPNIDVFFDNLQVTHLRGPILEETHYYPFGLTMAGISSSTIIFGDFKNKCYFNGNEEQDEEFSDHEGLKLYDFNARTYNSQIGRFLQMDEHAEVYDNWTPYNFSANNPILLSDPTGLDWYKNNDSGVFEWFEGSKDIEGFSRMETGTWSERNEDGFAYFFGEGPDGLIQSAPNDELEEVIVSAKTNKFLQMIAYQRSPEYIRWNTIVDKPSTWEKIWKGTFYLGKNEFGEEIYGAHYGGTVPTPSGRLSPKDIKKLYNSIKTVGKSINQLNKAVHTGKAPKGIVRFDKGRGTKNLPQDEVHFNDGSSLYRNGTWRHNKGHKLTNDQIKFLKEHGWEIP